MCVHTSSLNLALHVMLDPAAPTHTYRGGLAYGSAYALRIRRRGSEAVQVFLAVQVQGKCNLF